MIDAISSDVVDDGIERRLIGMFHKLSCQGRESYWSKARLEEPTELTSSHSLRPFWYAALNAGVLVK